MEVWILASFRTGRLILFVVLVPACWVGAAAARGPKLEKTKRYARDHLIVKFKEQARAVGLRALQAKAPGRAVRTFRSSGAVLIKLAPGQDDPVLISRQCLHARRLKLRHPRTHQPMELEAPLPDDIAGVLAALRTHRGT